jgi:hypothetical protein
MAHAALTRPQKITFGEMRSTGVHGALISCADCKCSHGRESSRDYFASLEPPSSTFPPFLTHFVKVSLRILAGSLCAARGGISDHARRKCLGVGASHFLASSTVMAEAPLVIDPAVTKSNAADMSFGPIIAYSPPCEQISRSLSLESS